MFFQFSSFLPLPFYLLIQILLLLPLFPLPLLLLHHPPSPLQDYPDHTYLSTFKFVPGQDEELERRICDNHKKHTGQSPAEADLNLLETARRCELYGTKMHPGKVTLTTAPPSPTTAPSPTAPPSRSASPTSLACPSPLPYLYLLPLPLL